MSLSSKGMSDNTLNSLMGRVPSRCILLLEDLDAAFTRSVNRDSSSTGAPPTTPGETKKAAATEESDGSTLSLSGLLNSLDGVAAAEGRLLFATTNHIERLDPALSRPGRMDVWVNFSNATKWQAEGIFKCFFPSAESRAKRLAEMESAGEETPSSDGTTHLPGSRARKSKVSTHSAPLLTDSEISDLAKQFADAIPEGEMSVSFFLFRVFVSCRMICAPARLGSSRLLQSHWRSGRISLALAPCFPRGVLRCSLVQAEADAHLMSFRSHPSRVTCSRTRLARASPLQRLPSGSSRSVRPRQSSRRRRRRKRRRRYDKF